MADPVTSGQAVQQLANDLFSTSIWNCMRSMADSSGNIYPAIMQNINSLCRVGLAIGFFALCLQLILDLVNQTYGQGIHPLVSIRKSLIKALFVGLLLVPYNYKTITVNIIAKPCDALSEAITVGYSDNFLESTSNIFNVFGDAGAKKQSIFTSAFWEQLSTSLIASVVYIVAAACTFIMPMLQSVLFLFAFYLGPLCIPFLICDLTSNIARGWLSLILAVAFMSVIGALSFLVADTANLVSRMQQGGGWENVFLILVYGILSIVLFAMSFPIAAFLFNASGAIGSAATSPTGAIGKTANLTKSAATIGTNLTKSVTSLGAGQVAKHFERVGNKALAGGDTNAAQKAYRQAESTYKFAHTMQTGGRGGYQEKAREMGSKMKKQNSDQEPKSGDYSPNV